MSEKSTSQSSERSQAELMQLHRQLQETATTTAWSDPSFWNWLRTLEGPTLGPGRGREGALLTSD